MNRKRQKKEEGGHGKRQTLGLSHGWNISIMSRGDPSTKGELVICFQNLFGINNFLEIHIIYIYF